jgi:hypothetical protein
VTFAARRARASSRVAASLASCLLVSIAALSLVAEARAQERVRVSRDGRSVTFVERGRAHALALGDKVGAARIEDAKLLLATRRFHLPAD